MLKRTSYKKELFIYFFLIFVLFTVVVAIFQYSREKQFKAKKLESFLNVYTDFVNGYIHQKKLLDKESLDGLDSLIQIMPRNDIRITVINEDGIVLYDNFHLRHLEMENHKNRPEIKTARFNEKGSHIRVSESTKQNLYYYAKRYEDYYVRAAVIYSISIKELLKIENAFLYFIVLLFLFTSAILLYVTNKIGDSINKLKNFAVKAGKNEAVDASLPFPDNELGTIGNEIINIYNNLKKTNKELRNEREKLFYHLQMTKNGVAFFSENNELIVANNHFIQLLSFISDIAITKPKVLFEIPEFKLVVDFIFDYQRVLNPLNEKKLPIINISFQKNLRFFEVGCIIFKDKSYEISINDVTKSEKQKKIKQEMTSNIAHELKTPVTSIKAYLETILSENENDIEKQKYFIQKAAAQTERLAGLVQDISVLNRIEEASDLFDLEDVNILFVINEVVENLHLQIANVNAIVNCNVDENTNITGNKSLIYSVFYNLLNNALNYGGSGMEVNISEFMSDAHFVFISFSDNGPGIEEKHHSRIFERFYRDEQGRTRATGGTGLGLAIVKNAVLFHGGEISLKNRTGGGAEFIFSLKKNTKKK